MATFNGYRFTTVPWLKWLSAKACFYSFSPLSWNTVTTAMWAKSTVANYCIPKQRFPQGNQGNCICSSAAWLLSRIISPSIPVTVGREGRPLYYHPYSRLLYWGLCRDRRLQAIYSEWSLRPDCAWVAKNYTFQTKQRKLKWLKRKDSVTWIGSTCWPHTACRGSSQMESQHREGKRAWGPPLTNKLFATDTY